MTKLEFAAGMIKLNSENLKKTPVQVRFDKLVFGWYDDFKEFSSGLFGNAIKNYCRESDYFPSERALLEAVKVARKTYRETSNTGLNFNDPMVCDDIITGLSVWNDVKNGVDPSGVIRERKENQIKDGINVLKQATPSMTERQRNALILRIADIPTNPIPFRVGSRKWLHDNAMEIISEGGR